KVTDLTWLTTSYDLGFATATYVGSYLDADDDSYLPLYFTVSVDDADAPMQGRYRTDYSTVTQELRLADNDRTGIDWTLGLYYEPREMRERGEYLLADSTTPASTEYDYDGLDDPTYDNYYGSAWQTDEEQRSAFGEIAYWLNDEVGISAGVRYVQH